MRNPQLHPAPQSGVNSTSKATACHSGDSRRRHPVLGGACAAVTTPHTISASPLASSHQLMPSNHTMFQHKAARCSLSHAAPRAPASHLPVPTGRHQHPAGSVCANIQCTPVSVPRSCHTAVPRVIPPGVIQAAVPGDACRAPERSCGKATALPWRRLHPAVPAPARGAHGALWSPSSILATIPQAQGLAMHCVALSPQCRLPALQGQAPSSPKEGLKIH